MLNTLITLLVEYRDWLILGGIALAATCFVLGFVTFH